MRVAITGSSGLIGTALRRSLEADRHEPIRVVRHGGGPGTIHWDPEAGEIDARGLEGVDAVVHLAGEGIGERRWTDEQKCRIRDSRVRGTTLLAETLASLDRPPRVLVSASGIDAYGDRGDEELTEASPPARSGFMPELVAAWEAATEPARAAGIRVVTTRSGMVLDRDGGGLARMVRLARFGLLGRLGSGRQWMSWITLVDEVRAIRFLVDHDELHGPVNLTAPGPVTNAEFTKALGRVLRRPTFVPIPRFGPSLVVGRELADVLLFQSKRVLPEVLQRAGFRFEHPEIEAALRAVLGRDAHEGP